IPTRDQVLGIDGAPLVLPVTVEGETHFARFFRAGSITSSLNKPLAYFVEDITPMRADGSDPRLTTHPDTTGNNLAQHIFFGEAALALTKFLIQNDEMLPPDILWAQGVEGSVAGILLKTKYRHDAVLGKISSFSLFMQGVGDVYRVP